jgi:hypothetical protein
LNPKVPKTTRLGEIRVDGPRSQRKRSGSAELDIEVSRDEDSESEDSQTETVKENRRNTNQGPTVRRTKQRKGLAAEDEETTRVQEQKTEKNPQS